MKNVTIHTIIDMLHSDPQGVSLKFGIPLRTVYSWCENFRKPPDYVLNMMLNIILLERRSGNGNTSEKLEAGMGGIGKAFKEACEESKSET